MKPAKRLRKELEAKFTEFGDYPVKKISPILRVAGELGSFGDEGIENIKVIRGEAECDIVISAQAWSAMTEDEIYTFIKPRVLDALRSFIQEIGMNVPDCTKKMEQNKAGEVTPDGAPRS